MSSISQTRAELTEQSAEPSIASQQPNGAEFLVPLLSAHPITPHRCISYTPSLDFNVTPPIDYWGIKSSPDKEMYHY
jgi:hypothetical protein